MLRAATNSRFGLTIRVIGLGLGVAIWEILWVDPCRRQPRPRRHTIWSGTRHSAARAGGAAAGSWRRCHGETAHDRRQASSDGRASSYTSSMRHCLSAQAWLLPVVTGPSDQYIHAASHDNLNLDSDDPGQRSGEAPDARLQLVNG